MSDGKCIVKYLRLSLEDEDMLDESNSITNQRIVIGQYIASKNEFKNTEVLEFKDDGYSGTNFDRPGFQSMMELVRDGKVSTIIVKDLSRFGRNHIEVDTYLEQIFPFMNVRFIAINDNVDSMKYESGMPGIDVGFRNIINEHHSIDTSVKVKRTLIQRQKAGKYMGARAPYGYLKPDEDVTSLVINPETAPVVKMIFQKYLNGMNITQLARYLNEQKIIDELEPQRRNAWCGSIGYLSFCGNMDTSITIRTLTAINGQIFCSAGGGIVADSQEEAEYQETFDKVNRILKQLEK